MHFIHMSSMMNSRKRVEPNNKLPEAKKRSQSLNGSVKCHSVEEDRIQHSATNAR